MVEHCAFQHLLMSSDNKDDLIKQLLVNVDITTVDSIIVAPWGIPARQTLQHLTATYFAHVTVLDISEYLGNALAATPALAWTIALDLIQMGSVNKCLVLNAGCDGGIGAVVLGKMARFDVATACGAE
jgi:hypothetical protein